MESGRPRPASNGTELFMRWLLSFVENLCDFLDCVPIARVCWHAEQFLDLAKVTELQSDADQV
jgi:hypothetical protein